MTRQHAGAAGSPGGLAFADRTDFYEAWTIVNGAVGFSPTVRARAFAMWVGLFGRVDSNGVVTITNEAVAEEFCVSRASWVEYRKLLSSVGLIDQERMVHQQNRPTVVRLRPPLRSSSSR